VGLAIPGPSKAAGELGRVCLFVGRRCRKVRWKLGSTPSVIDVSVDRQRRPLTFKVPVLFQGPRPDQAPHGDDCRDNEQGAKVELWAGHQSSWKMIGSCALRSASHCSALIPPKKQATASVIQKIVLNRNWGLGRRISPFYHPSAPPAGSGEIRRLLWCNTLFHQRLADEFAAARTAKLLGRAENFAAVAINQQD
jgi:hypothetical protein